MKYPENIRPYIDILDKVESFEKKSEFNRLLLVLTSIGFISVIAGLLEYFFYRFIGCDATFFIFNTVDSTSLSPADEPVIFFSTWLIHLLPLLIAFIFSTGSTGVLNWNKAYRIIGIIILVVAVLTEVIVLIIGIQNSIFIPIVWGSAFCFCFFFSSWILPKYTEIYRLRGYFAVLGIISVVIGLISSIFVPVEMSMFFFCSSIGLILSFSSMAIFFNRKITSMILNHNNTKGVLSSEERSGTND